MSSLFSMVSEVAVFSAVTIQGNLHIAFAAVGAALGIGMIGARAAEATSRNPSAAGNVLVISIILAALIEGIVFFAIFLAK